MTEPIFNFNFDGTYESVSQEPVTIKDFGQFQLAARRMVTMFSKGASIEIPEIQMVQIEGKPFARKGIKEGGKTEAFFFARTTERQDGTEFTEVRIFTTLANIPLTKPQVDNLPVKALDSRQQAAYAKWENENSPAIWLSDWSNMQIPAIQASGKLAETIGNGKPFWGAADNWNVGRKPNIVNEGQEDERKYYERFWFNFVAFDSKEAMVAAREAHFAGLNGSSEASFSYPVTPVNWAGNEQAMRDYTATQYAAKPESLGAIAKEVGLVAEAKDTSGKDVDYKAILSDILNIPAPMITV